MGIGDAFDFVVDGISEAKDAAVETFSGIGEFSRYGLIMGIIGVAVLLITQKWMLGSFTKFMKPGSAIFITIITYAATFVAGYFIGKRFEDN